MVTFHEMGPLETLLAQLRDYVTHKFMDSPNIFYNDTTKRDGSHHMVFFVSLGGPAKDEELEPMHRLVRNYLDNPASPKIFESMSFSDPRLGPLLDFHGILFRARQIRPRGKAIAGENAAEVIARLERKGIIEKRASLRL